MLLPYTIRTIIKQIGTGLHGGGAYCGGHSMSFLHPEDRRDCEYRPRRPSKITQDGFVDYEVGVSIRVNGKKGQQWTIFVTYEQDDTYTVRLWRKAGKGGEVLDELSDVYGDELQGVFEQMYDSAIEKYNGGFIPC